LAKARSGLQDTKAMPRQPALRGAWICQHADAVLDFSNWKAGLGFSLALTRPASSAGFPEVA
jgi:hypothetical protein